MAVQWAKIITFISGPLLLNHLFFVRGKLGDTLIAYSAVRAFIERHPGDHVTLLTRKNYAFLLQGEPGLDLLPYSGQLPALARIVARRLFRRFDVFASLWGFGGVVPRCARASGAPRRLHFCDRYPAVLNEFPPPLPHDRQVDAAWSVLQMLDPALPKPQRLHIPSLAARRRADATAIGLCPLADEKRRNLSPAALGALLHSLRQRYPDRPLRVFVNPGEADIVPADAPAGTEIVSFRTLPELVEAYCDLGQWFGTDTGLYHLAAAMDIPCTLFHGPTQPRKIVMPEQATRAVRLAALGEAHCEEKRCHEAACLNQAVLNYCNDPVLLAESPGLEQCLLSPLDPAARRQNRPDENPYHQA